MSTRPIKKIYSALRDDIEDLKTVRPLPTSQIQIIDPFLFLNHHGPQVYKPNNSGLPFGPHPHRGFQTVTFILDGDIAHRDSGGHESVIGPGGVQWMNAGRGLVHEEISSEAFKKSGGPLEILQLWVNLPKKFKMSEPFYLGLQADQIPIIQKDKAKIQLVSGSYENATGPFKPSTDITLLTLDLTSGADFKISIPATQNIFFYVVRGEVRVNGMPVTKTHLVEFLNQNEELDLHTKEGAYVLLGYAEPYHEKVVYGGPFIMNSEEEIRQAFADYHSGRLS